MSHAFLPDKSRICPLPRPRLLPFPTYLTKPAPLHISLHKPNHLPPAHTLPQSTKLAPPPTTTHKPHHAPRALSNRIPRPAFPSPRRSPNCNRPLALRRIPHHAGPAGAELVRRLSLLALAWARVGLSRRGIPVGRTRPLLHRGLNPAGPGIRGPVCHGAPGNVTCAGRG